VRVLLIATVFNSLSQRIYCELKEMNHSLSVQLSTSDQAMEKAVDTFSPDIIICPYLIRFIPASIYEHIPTFIIHPGIRGDKGPHSLDHALLQKKETWGVSVIRANGEFDGGDIYAQSNFKMRCTKKSSLYRREVSSASSKAIKQLLSSMLNEQISIQTQLKTPMHTILKQEDRKINWNKDSNKEIILKINAADSYPGVLDTILGKEVYLFGVWDENLEKDSLLYELASKAQDKEIFAKRDGAVCIKTREGALWISHMKEVGKFKLPSTYVLKDLLRGTKEVRIPLFLEKRIHGFHEIYLEMKNDIAYLYFNFHNGAFSSEQSIRLKYAIEEMRDRCKVLVLMGGDEFFSNGIHLNILEDSKKQGEDGWSNINAMNDMVRSVLLSDDFLTVAALRGGAGAGGFFLALACDYVLAREGLVFNPHYKTMGLSGSEFHTYTLPKRVGEEKAESLLDEALPILSSEAKKIGLIDKVLSEKYKDFKDELDTFLHTLVSDEDAWFDQLDKKRDNLEEDSALITQKHKKELVTMHPEFWDEKSSFHALRRAFVYKQCPHSTPKQLQYKEAKCMSTV